MDPGARHLAELVDDFLGRGGSVVAPRGRDRVALLAEAAARFGEVFGDRPAHTRPVQAAARMHEAVEDGMRRGMHLVRACDRGGGTAAVMSARIRIPEDPAAPRAHVEVVNLGSTGTLRGAGAACLAAAILLADLPLRLHSADGAERYYARLGFEPEGDRRYILPIQRCREVRAAVTQSLLRPAERGVA